MTDTKELKICSECERETETLLVNGVSAIYGTYYDGDPVCHHCIDRHYEDAVIIHEATTP